MFKMRAISRTIRRTLIERAFSRRGTRQSTARSRLSGGTTLTQAWIIAVTVFSLSVARAEERTQSVREAIIKVYAVHNTPDYYNPWSMRGTQSSTGSGAIIEGQRILTNGHVVRDQTFIQVRRFGDSRRYQARVSFVSHPADLALLTVDDPTFFAGVEPLTFGPLPDTQEEVNVYGFPMGGDTLSITKGVISRIEHQTYVHSSVPLLAAQIDAAINPGNSGGPAIVDDRIVGVAMQGVPRATSIGYIVPAPIIEHFLTDIQTGERSGIPGLGIHFQKMENPDLRRRYSMEDEQSGVLIVHVVHNSSSDGILRKRDVLLRIDGKPVADDGTVEFRPKERTSFSYPVQRKQLGDSVEIELLRDGILKTLQVDLTHPMEQNWLVPMEVYDVMPTYYIYGGVVFAPLNKNLLLRWGPNWRNTAPRQLVTQLDQNYVTEDQDEVVVLLKVLAADVNQGYHDEKHWLIDAVNGEEVRNLKHLIKLVEAGEGDEFIEFTNTGGEQIVLDRQKVKGNQAAILSLYRIQEDRSEELRLP